MIPPLVAGGAYVVRMITEILRRLAENLADPNHLSSAQRAGPLAASLRLKDRWWGPQQVVG